MKKLKYALSLGFLMVSFLQTSTLMAIGDEKEKTVASATGKTSDDKAGCLCRIPWLFHW